MVGKHTHVLIIKDQTTQLSLKFIVCRQQDLNLSFSHHRLWRPNHRQMGSMVASEGREGEGAIWGPGACHFFAWRTSGDRIAGQIPSVPHQILV